MIDRTIICDLRFTFHTEGESDVNPEKFDEFAKKMANEFKNLLPYISDVTPVYDPDTNAVSVKVFDKEVE
ncbi:MAG: hypothetical protein J6U54_01735 [Clostridiales bacterium]|nr:hypothetical protein [Clostridiales bacterium]